MCFQALSPHGRLGSSRSSSVIPALWLTANRDTWLLAIDSNSRRQRSRCGHPVAAIRVFSQVRLFAATAPVSYRRFRAFRQLTVMRRLPDMLVVG